MKSPQRPEQCSELRERAPSSSGSLLNNPPNTTVPAGAQHPWREQAAPPDGPGPPSPKHLLTVFSFLGFDHTVLLGPVKAPFVPQGEPRPQPLPTSLHRLRAPAACPNPAKEVSEGATHLLASSCRLGGTLCEHSQANFLAFRCLYPAGVKAAQAFSCISHRLQGERGPPRTQPVAPALGCWRL